MGIFSFTLIKKTELQKFSLEKDSLETQIATATEFISEIEKGNLDVKFNQEDDLSENHENDQLAESLINLRTQLLKVSQEEKQRTWVAENRSKFMDILRSSNNGLNEISENIIRNLVKCLSANQGGLFIINDENPDDVHIELAACYAYERKKFLTKRIDLGEGLVGQTILEKESTYLTEIPTHYLNITSGLGEATPRNLLIVPLKLEDKVFGAVEIASFNEIKQYEIEFTEQLGESIASSIASVKNNHRTKKLLEETQQQAEEMRAQEEEVRQNMEELSATQEEMQRVMKEMQESEAFIKGVIDSTTDSIITVDTNYKVISCNKVITDTYKSSGMEVVKGFDIFKIFKDDQKSTYKSYYDRAFQGEAFEVNERYVHGEKEQYFVMYYSPLRNEQGEIIGAACFGKDITEMVLAKDETERLLEESQQQAEEMKAQEEELRQNMEELSATQEEMQRIMSEVQESEAFVKGLIDATNDSILTIDKDYKLISCNKMTYDTYKPAGLEVVKGFDVLQLFSEEQRNTYKGYYDRALKGEFFEITENYKFGDNEQYFAVTFSPLRNKEGEIFALACFGKDVTETVMAKENAEALLEETQQQTEEMKAQEEELRQNMEELSATQEEMEKVMQEVQGKEKFMNDLVNATTDTIFSVDLDYNIHVFNETFKKTWEGQGFKVEKGLSLKELYADPKEWKHHKDVLDRAFGGERFAVEVTKQIGDQTLYFHIVYAPIRNQEEKIIAVAVFGKDITESVLAKEQTENLLKESQMQAEELRAQEEEMRQNMEELSATQEEMQKIMLEVEGKEKFMSGVIDSTTDSIFAIDKDYKIIIYNHTFKSIWDAQGCDVKKGMNIIDIYPDPEEWKLHLDKYQQAFKGKHVSITIPKKIGDEMHYFTVNYSPVKNQENKVDAVAVFAKDITEAVLAKEQAEALLEETQQQTEEMKAQEEELRQNMEELSATQEEMERAFKGIRESEFTMNELLNLTQDSIYTLDADGRILQFNRYFDQSVKAYGYQIEKGFDYMNLLTSEKEQKEHKKILKKVFAGETIQMPLDYVDGDNEVHLMSTYSPVRNIEGNIISVAVHSKDITELVLAKRQASESK